MAKATTTKTSVPFGEGVETAMRKKGISYRSLAEPPACRPGTSTTSSTATGPSRRTT